MDYTLMIFFLALLISVIIHELGHYGAFRLFGGKVDEFSIGFGPTIFSKKWGSSNFTLRLFMLGGYVQPAEKDFRKYSYVKKMVFFSAGTILNFLLFFISFGIASITHGKTFMEGLLVAWKSLIFIIVNLGEIFKSLNIDLLFSSQGSFESQIQMVNEIGTNTEFWMMLAVINITLIFLNSLPIPSLDGGKIIISTFEHLLISFGVSKDKVEKITNPIYYFSWVFLMGFIALQIVTSNTYQFIEDATYLKLYYGMTTMELILWILLITVFFINIIVFILNRVEKIKRA